MKIALFGGAFDPPHRGHQRVARSLVEQKIVDEVWFVPVKRHPFDKQLSADKHRVAMLKLIIEPIFQQKIETYELDHSQKSYSFLTLKHFQKTFPHHSFRWVIGADNVENFSKWFKYKELLEEFPVYIYPRDRVKLTQLSRGMVWLDQVVPITVASSDIREKVKRKESITELVDPEVERYIKENQLYL